MENVYMQLAKQWLFMLIRGYTFIYSDEVVSSLKHWGRHLGCEHHSVGLPTHIRGIQVFHCSDRSVLENPLAMCALFSGRI